MNEPLVSRSPRLHRPGLFPLKNFLAPVFILAALPLFLHPAVALAHFGAPRKGVENRARRVRSPISHHGVWFSVISGQRSVRNGTAGNPAPL